MHNAAWLWVVDKGLASAPPISPNTLLDLPQNLKLMEKDNQKRCLKC